MKLQFSFYNPYINNTSFTYINYKYLTNINAVICGLPRSTSFSEPSTPLMIYCEYFMNYGKWNV